MFALFTFKILKNWYNLLDKYMCNFIFKNYFSTPIMYYVCFSGF